MQEVAKQDKLNSRGSYFQYIKNMKTKSLRIAVLLLLLTTTILGTHYLPVWLVSPQRNISVLANQIDQSGKYHTSGAALYVYDSEDYIVTLYSGEDSYYHPYLYITASKIKGQYAVDLIKGPGEENAEVLYGDEALAFLKKYEIELTEIEEAIAQLQSSD